MIKIHEPDDLISISLHNIFDQRKDDENFIKHVTDWNKKIVLHLEPFYPVTVTFQGNEIRFEVGACDNPDMKMTLTLSTMLEIAFGRLSPFLAISENKMTMEGLGDDSEKLVRFYNIFVDSMELCAAKPNINYYEHKKKTR